MRASKHLWWQPQVCLVVRLCGTFFPTTPHTTSTKPQTLSATAGSAAHHHRRRQLDPNLKNQTRHQRKQHTHTHNKKQHPESQKSSFNPRSPSPHILIKRHTYTRREIARRLECSLRGGVLAVWKKCEVIVYSLLIVPKANQRAHTHRLCNKQGAPSLSARRRVPHIA